MTQPLPPPIKLSNVIAALDLAQHNHPHKDDFVRVLLEKYVPAMIDEIVNQRATIMQFCEHLTALQQQMHAWADETATPEPETAP